MKSLSSITPVRASLPARRLLALLAALSPSLHAAEIIKANNTDAIDQPTSWVGGVVPGAADIAIIDATVAASGTTSYYIPQNLNWDVSGIKVLNNANLLVLDSFFASPTPTINLGSAGLDFSGATSGTTFTFDNPTLNVSVPQTWSVADGATVALTGALTRTSGSTIKFNLGATGTGVFTASSFGTPNAIFTYATINGTDFAALDATRKVVAGSSLGTYVSNPNSGTGNPDIVGTYGTMDVVNSNTGGINAFRVSSSAGLSVGGIRFGTAHATGLNWVGDIPSGRNFNVGNQSILVAPAVGAHQVQINGAGNIRLAAGSQLGLLQYNTEGPLVLNASINQPNGTGASVMKSGPGTAILANNSNSYGGGTIINEGTLQIGNGGTSGVLGGGIVTNRSNLAFNRTDAVTVLHTITGTGQVTQAGTGETIFSTNVNTYTGATNLNAGTLTFANLDNLGAGTAVNFAGGALKWASGNTADISARTLTFNTGGATINTNGNNLTFANPIGNGGAGGLNKTGAGVLTLQGASTYSGASTLAAGTLVVANSTGSATGSGPVSVAGGTTLTGGGSIGGTVSTATGSIISPGSSGVGTLTVGGLNLAGGSILDLEFASTSSHDKIVATQTDGLSINGGGLRLFTPGSSSAYSAAGTYNLFQYSGALQGSGASALSVLNPQAGYSYSFGSSGGFVTLQIVLDSILSQWIGSSSGSWNTAGNWSNGVPASNYTARFTSALGAPLTVTLDGNRSVNGMVFDSSPGYTISSGTSGSLTLSKSSGNAAVNVLTGDHTISAPVVLSSTAGITTNASSSLTLSGVVSGSGGIVKDGPGVLNLSNHNTFSGAINAVDGVISFGFADSLGSGAITLNGATLTFGAGNTADISAKAINFGLDGGTIDTNGNDVVFANPLGNSSAGSFIKAGSGSLTLMSDSTYQSGTSAMGGELIIAGNGSLGGATQTLHLDGGLVSPLTSITLDDGGANARPVTVGAAGGGFLVADGLTLTLPGVVSGTGILNKSGSGTLLITGNNSTYAGGALIENGAVNLGNNRANGQTGLGVGTITFGNGGKLLMNGADIADNGDTFGGLPNPIVVPASVTAEVRAPSRGGYNGVVTGTGTLDFYVDGMRFDVTGAWPDFAGVLNVRKTPTGDGLDTDDYRLIAAQNMPQAKVHIGAGVNVNQPFGPPNSSPFTTVHTFGELTAEAGSFLAGNTVGGRFNNYNVGSLNTDFVISGQFRGTLSTFGYGYPSLTKVGTGVLTLNGQHMMTGAVTVNAGTLKIMGAIERFYTGIGVDGVYGRLGTGTCDDTISLTPPETDFQETQPGSVTVAAGATLAGNGTLGGAITINGNLQPDSTGSLGGQLTLTGVASLTLASTATTTLDFGGTVFTGIKSTATGAVTYGGALKLNFPGTVYNGSYSLFDLTGTPTGAFAGVTVVTKTVSDTTVETPLTDNSGTWSGNVDSVSFSFNSATGVLTVSGGATAVLPGTPGSVAASAGNAQVALTWNAASNASSYIVKRSTVSGSGYQTVQSDIATTSYTDTGLVNGTTYYYVVQAKNGAGLSAHSLEVSATPVAAPAYTALEQWRFDEFGVYEDTGTVLAGNTEDFDGDGLVNILEYALGTDPTVANASPVVVGRNGNNLTLTYPRRAVDDPALTYSVLGSSDLTTAFTAGAGTTNTVGATSTYTDTVNLSVAGTRRFLRLSVTYTAP